ncbi:MAG TPA: hypothetical protein VGF01_16570, partial [Terracidiphilus sp.]
AVKHTICPAGASSEIVAFCADLVQYQSDVNSEVDAKTGKRTPGVWTGDLDELDLSLRHATPRAIQAISQNVALQAITNVQSASQIGLPSGIVQSPDQQTGPAGGASGTTSLISKAGSAALLSLALDTGTLTQSVNGATTTVTTNGDQLFRAITRIEPDCVVNCENDSWFEQNVLGRTNLSASFSLAQQSSTTVATSGQASGTTPTQVSNVAIPSGVGKLSGITVKFRLLNKYDPHSTKFNDAWRAALKNSTSIATALKAVGDATDPIAAVMTAKATPLDRPGIYAAAASDSTGAALAAFFLSYFNTAVAPVLSDSQVTDAVATVMKARAVYADAWRSVLEDAAGTLLSFQYSYNKPAIQPETHDFTLIGGYGFKQAGMLTFNGAFSIYGGTLPAGASYGRIHYGQASGEYDQSWSKTGQLQPQISLAGYWQYQPNPSILNIPAGTVAPGTNIPLANGTQEFVGTKGSLWVAQAKLTMKGGGGVNIPVGVSWSNKTDLLQGSKVGAQVGISYNFSSLGQLF